ncbi:hypothetical protein R0J91_04915 [Micrococcus sp. SIMBA_131]
MATPRGSPLRARRRAAAEAPPRRASCGRWTPGFARARPCAGRRTARDAQAPISRAQRFRAGP